MKNFGKKSKKKIYDKLFYLKNKNTKREKRNTVTLNDVINVLKRQGQTIRGFNK